MCSSKILPKYIGPFRVLHRKGNPYTTQLPRRMRTHPTFYVGRLRPYHQHEVSSSGEYNRHAQETPRDSFGPDPVPQSGSVVPHAGEECQPLRCERLNVSARSPFDRTRTPISRPIDKGGCVAPTPPKRDAPASIVRCDPTDCVRVAGDQPPPATPTNDLESIFMPPPQPVVDLHGG